MSRKDSQRGSALIYVFIGVILFAALALAFSRGTRETTSSSSSKTAKVRASEVLDYTSKIEQTVQKLLLNGCSETELNFEYDYSGSPVYTNPLAPGDGSCNVFTAQRAKLLLPAQMGIPFPTGSSVSGKLHFSSSTMSVSGSGNDTYIDLTLQILIDLDTCLEVNKMIGVNDNPPPSSTGAFGGTGFVGTFTVTDGSTIEINPSSSALYGKDSGCYNSSGSNEYYFYRTLIAK